MFDLDAYLRRIGVGGDATLAEIHRAHASAIPFENLDPQRGVPVSLATEDLECKLVAERRGGYCFEQNLLLKAALEALGARVQPLLARVRLGSEPGVTRPRSHLVLRVEDDSLVWHADVGFGVGTPLEPLPFGSGEEHAQSGWRFRILAEGPELVLQTVADGRWVDMYAFVPEPVPRADLEQSNWFTSTYPRSPFVTGLIVSTVASDGIRTTLSDWGGLTLSEQTPSTREVTPVEREQIPSLLAERFSLPGFSLDAQGRVVPSTRH